MAQRALGEHPKAKNNPADVKVKPIDPEVLRQQMLRPIPQFSLRGIVVIVLVLATLSWSISGTQTDLNTLREGLPSIANFLVRLFPPRFDFVRGTETTFIDGGEEFTISRFDTQSVILPLLRERQTVTLRDADGRLIPIANANDLSVTVNQRLAGQEQITYIVGGNVTTIGWPIIINSIIETIQMALIGTLGAVILSIPLSLMAARNISPHPIIFRSTRFLLNILRSIPELIYGLIFVAAVGLGPFPGVLALIFGSIGSLSRVFAEAIEQIDPQQVLAVQATGSGQVQTFVYAVIPQALPLLISYSIIFFESNVRSATILGLVGAGGIGFEINKYLSLFQYDRLMGTIIVLVVAVTIIDRFSNYVRSRFI